jgi:hypothetical protein
MKSLVASRSGVKKKAKQKFRVLGGERELEQLISLLYGHEIAEEGEDWDQIDVLVDCKHREEDRGVRREGIDRSIFVITDRKKLELLLRSIGTRWKCHPYDHYAKLAHPVDVNLFVRQGFTESSEETRIKLQVALNAISSMQRNGKVNIITGRTAQSSETFKVDFQRETGLEFTPQTFRKHRLRLLEKADAMVVLRTGLSESTAFEVAVNLCGGNSLPVFYAIEPGCEIKTTLLRELTGFYSPQFPNVVANVKYKVIAGGVQNICEDKDFQSFMQQVRTRK